MVEEESASNPSETIQSSLPSDGEYHNTDKIINKLVIEEHVVNRYEQAKKWQQRVGKKPTALVVGAYFLILIAAIVLNIWTEFSFNQISDIISIIFVILFLIAILGWLAKSIFKNRATNQPLLPEEAVYHRLSRSIQEYQSGNRDTSLDELLSAGQMMHFNDMSPFSQKFNKELNQYIDEVQRRDSEQFYKDTFPEVANKTLAHLSPVCDTNLEYIYTERSNLEQADDYTPIDMLKSYIGDWSQNKIIRILLPYIIVSPVIYLVYTQNQTLAQILAIVIVAIVQTYNRPSRDD